MNFCVNCKHLVMSANGPDYFKCGRTQRGIDPVTGIDKGHSYCSTERDDWGSDKRCGVGGRFFEPKEAVEA